NHVLKYDKDGNFKSAMELEMYALGAATGLKCFMTKDDKLNRYYIAGTVEYGATVHLGGKQVKGNTYIAAFDNSGKLLWSRTDTTESGNNGITNRLVIDESGHIYIVANTSYFFNEKRSAYFNGYSTKVSNDNPPEGGVLVMKMDKDGN